MQHGSGVVHATAAAALPAATPAPGMPAAAAATVTGKSGATQSPSRLDAALAKQQYALVSFEGYLAWCIRCTFVARGTFVASLSRVREAGMPAQVGAASLR
jgi:thiol:disulfide interchange protein